MGELLLANLLLVIIWLGVVAAVGLGLWFISSAEKRTRDNVLRWIIIFALIAALIDFVW